MAPTSLPAALAVRNLLEDLLGRDVTVKPGDPLKAEDVPTTVTAIYVNDSMKMAAVLGLDLPLAAYAGAALGLMPLGGAQDAIEDKELSPVLSENISELCNVITGLLNKEGSPHLRMYQVCVPKMQDPPPDAAAQLIALGNRLDLKVEVSRYGAGRLALSLLP
jgi:hypothetical protein